MIPTMTEPQAGESLLTFPCVFPLKVMGRREDGQGQFFYAFLIRDAEGVAPFSTAVSASGALTILRYSAFCRR